MAEDERASVRFGVLFALDQHADPGAVDELGLAEVERNAGVVCRQCLVQALRQSGPDTTSSSPVSTSTTPPASSLRLIESSVATRGIVMTIASYGCAIRVHSLDTSRGAPG